MINSKLFKRFIAIALSCLTLVNLTACAGGDPYADYSDKTVLEIGNVDAGLGDEWLIAVKTEFEKAYADYEGKAETSVKLPSLS